MKKFKIINGKYIAFVECPDCKKVHPVSHKNYYTQKKGIRNLSFRCANCGHLRAAKTRRNPNLRKITPHGYRKMYLPENPMADKRGEIYEHRFIMSQILNRPLKSNEHVHHKNGNKIDNRPKNLELIEPKHHVLNTQLQTYINHLESILTKHNIKF